MRWSHARELSLSLETFCSFQQVLTFHWACKPSVHSSRYWHFIEPGNLLFIPAGTDFSLSLETFCSFQHVLTCRRSHVCRLVSLCSLCFTLFMYMVVVTWLRAKYNYFSLRRRPSQVFYSSVWKLAWNYFKIVSETYCSSWIFFNMFIVAKIIRFQFQAWLHVK